MKKMAIMQPYFFPYIGYFQLVHSVSQFVFYDDVTFIKNGWINRNRILINGEARYITIPCRHVSSNKPIQDIKHGLTERAISKLFKKIKFTYGNAPQFKTVFPLIESVILKKTPFISEIAIESVKKTSEFLGLNCKFLKSSENFDNRALDPADRIIDICKAEGVNTYVNPIGGSELYSRTYFKKSGIELLFLEPDIKKYSQFDNEFTSGLSLIDVLMFNSPEKIKSQLLDGYKLIRNE